MLSFDWTENHVQTMYINLYAIDFHSPLLVKIMSLIYDLNAINILFSGYSLIVISLRFHYERPNQPAKLLQRMQTYRNEALSLKPS
jgi:hypothetical protein